LLNEFRFLTLWKDNGPDIPVYRQAKPEYAELRTGLNCTVLSKGAMTLVRGETLGPRD
jgi:hypothetical protein